jgi:aromatic ring-opening dioxygenase catalytic subunit (LigB family)
LFPSPDNNAPIEAENRLLPVSAPELNEARPTGIVVLTSHWFTIRREN